jgi:hypothetical protein
MQVLQEHFTCHDPRASRQNAATFICSLATCGGGVHPWTRYGSALRRVTAFELGDDISQ